MLIIVRFLEIVLTKDVDYQHLSASTYVGLRLCSDALIKTSLNPLKLKCSQKAVFNREIRLP